MLMNPHWCPIRGALGCLGEYTALILTILNQGGGELDQPKIKIKTDIFKPDDLVHRPEVDKAHGKFHDQLPSWKIYGIFKYAPS